MANRLETGARTVHGQNPLYLVEKIVRNKIYDNAYWKEHCFALTADSLIDKAVELKEVGGCYGGFRKPTKFICLLLKMLQIQPEKDIILEFIKNEEFKYLRVLGAMYLRLVGTPLDIYQYLEPLYVDFRKIKLRTDTGIIVFFFDTLLIPLSFFLTFISVNSYLIHSFIHSLFIYLFIYLLLAIYDIVVFQGVSRFTSMSLWSSCSRRSVCVASSSRGSRDGVSSRTRMDFPFANLSWEKKLMRKLRKRQKKRRKKKRKR